MGGKENKMWKALSKKYHDAIVEAGYSDALSAVSSSSILVTPEPIQEPVADVEQEPVPENEKPMNQEEKLESIDHKEKLAIFYQKFAPEKEKDIDATLEKFEGKENKVWKALSKKYHDAIVEAGYSDALSAVSSSSILVT